MESLAREPVQNFCASLLKTDWQPHGFTKQPTNPDREGVFSLGLLFTKSTPVTVLVSPLALPPDINLMAHQLNERLESLPLLWERDGWVIQGIEEQFNRLGQPYLCNQVLVGFNHSRSLDLVIYYLDEITISLTVVEKQAQIKRLVGEIQRKSAELASLNARLALISQTLV